MQVPQGRGSLIVSMQKWWNKAYRQNEARKRFYLVDKQGLLFDDMPDLTPEQRPFARSRSEFANSAELTSLEKQR